MNLQQLGKVETADTYLDQAFRAATQKAEALRAKKDQVRMNRLQKSKTIEKHKLNTVAITLVRAMEKILNSFPHFIELPRFYQELVRLRLDFGEFKRCLGAVKWLHGKASSVQREYAKKIEGAQTFDDVNRHRRGFYGRIASFVKQIDPQLKTLEEMRRTLKEFPTIKTSLPTACLFGFPNVGKSTLLARLTTAKPEIKAYPFTTKNLNIGYIQEPGKKIQVIDAPGTLDRFEKMNDIEKQAYLAVKHCADIIVYVFDPTDEVPEEKQVQLLENVKKYCPEIVVYISKVDVAEAKRIKTCAALAKKQGTKDVFTDGEKLKQRLLLLPPKETMPAEQKATDEEGKETNDNDDEDAGDDEKSYNKEE